VASPVHFLNLDDSLEGVWLWEIENFLVTQILREINFGKFWVPKNAIFAVTEAVNFCFRHILALRNGTKSSKSNFRASIESKW